jgi:hypothetical protein
MSIITALPASWAKRLGILFLVLIGALILGLVIFQKVSDGPYGMLQGGHFRSGEMADSLTANYEELANKPTELLLVGPGSSRTLGIIMHDGMVYISCDLGFMWNRFEGMQKLVLNLIYVFKTWHLKAIEDGRAELRVEGKRYPGYLYLVEDEKLNTALKTQLEDLARQWIAPTLLGPVPDAPNSILFFRFEPGSQH